MPWPMAQKTGENWEPENWPILEQQHNKGTAVGFVEFCRYARACRRRAKEIKKTFIRALSNSKKDPSLMQIICMN